MPVFHEAAGQGELESLCIRCEPVALANREDMQATSREEGGALVFPKLFYSECCLVNIGGDLGCYTTFSKP